MPQVLSINLHKDILMKDSRSIHEEVTPRLTPGYLNRPGRLPIADKQRSCMEIYLTFTCLPLYQDVSTKV